MVGMPEAQAAPVTIVTLSPSTTLMQEPVEIINMESTTPSSAKVTVRPIKQVEYHEFIEELENSFDGETTTQELDDRFIIDAPSICPVGTQRDHRDKCRKII